MPKIDYERLRRWDREPLIELDDVIARNIRREAEAKARELEEKERKKRKKRKKRQLKEKSS